MDFTVDFFKDEVRHGFYVPTAIKQMWAAQLLVLKEIDRVCEKYGISYFADWGTFLGTIRHGGYVPWDDDFDICMRREDYVRFREVADRELPPEFFIHDYASKEDHWLFLARVVNNSKISFNEDYLDSHFNYPYMAGIDIFIQDYIYRDPELERARDKEVMYIIAVADAIVNDDKTPDVIEYHLREIEEKYGTHIDRSLGSRAKGIALYRLAEEQMMRVPSGEADEMGQIFPFILKGGKGRPKADYENLIRLPFENTTVPVPSSYHRLLSTRYGDYLQVRKIWTGHDYPYFEKQWENLKKVADFDLPQYEFDRSMLETKEVNDAVDALTASRGYREVLFVAAGPERWRGQFARIYDDIRDSEDTLVHVVVLPVLFKDPLGRIKATDEEIWTSSREGDYPGHVVITPWYEYDVAEHFPETIYIQDVYDGENPCLTVPPAYYARVLRQYCRELVYIPPFDTDEFETSDYNDIYNLKHYILKPGFVYADKVYVQSAHLKEVYVDRLTEWAGEYTREYWRWKLVDRESGSDPEGDKRMDASKKKLIYMIGVNELAEHKDILIDAVKKRFETFAENGDQINVSIELYPADLGQWEGVDPELSKRLFDMVRDYAANTWCEFDEEGFRNPSGVGFGPLKERYTTIASEYDAYYGSPSPLALMFTHEKKPVMIADLNV